MKKLLSILFIFTILVSSVFSFGANAAYDKVMESLELYSDCVLLVSADNGEIIFEKNAGKQTSPASLTKVVTAIVVLENCENLEEIVTVPESCIRELDGTGSSLGGLKAGEQISVYNLLCCLLISSANEAANTLADHVFGDRDKFIAEMNAVAEKLGCVNSHFVNPHGLDNENQYVTAKDMAEFMKYAMEFPAFEEIAGRVSYVLPESNLQGERTIRNTNYMMSSAYAEYYCKYVRSGKTGSTSTAGKCVVSTASKDGYNYIAVCLDAPFNDIDDDGYNENGAFLDSKEMYEWAFRNIELVAISDTTRIVGQVPVRYAKTTDYITLTPAETVYGLVPVGTDSGSLYIELIEDTVPEFVKAPVEKGEVIGKARVLYAGETLKEIDVVASMSVERGFFVFLGATAKTIFSNWIFRIIALVVIAALGVLLFIRYKKKKDAASDSKDYRILNYNDFMKLK